MIAELLTSTPDTGAQLLRILIGICFSVGLLILLNTGKQKRIKENAKIAGDLSKNGYEVQSGLVGVSGNENEITDATGIVMAITKLSAQGDERYEEYARRLIKTGNRQQQSFAYITILQYCLNYRDYSQSEAVLLELMQNVSSPSTKGAAYWRCMDSAISRCDYNRAFEYAITGSACGGEIAGDLLSMAMYLSGVLVDISLFEKAEQAGGRSNKDYEFYRDLIFGRLEAAKRDGMDARKRCLQFQQLANSMAKPCKLLLTSKVTSDYITSGQKSGDGKPYFLGEGLVPPEIAAVEGMGFVFSLQLSEFGGGEGRLCFCMKSESWSVAPGILDKSMYYLGRIMPDCETVGLQSNICNGDAYIITTVERRDCPCTTELTAMGITDENNKKIYELPEMFFPSYECKLFGYAYCPDIDIPQEYDACLIQFAFSRRVTLLINSAKLKNDDFSDICAVIT